MARHQRREALREMTSYHSPQVDVPVRLNTNESPFPPPSDWVERLGRIASSIDWNRYPDRSARALREAIGARHGVPAEMVFVANGSNEVIQTILLAHAGAGRTVATFEPTYQMYAQIARVTGADVVQGERRADFALDAAEVERVARRYEPAVTFLCNPNNPTGLVEPRENLQTMLEVSTGVVVADEAYAEFADWSAADMVHDDSTLAGTRTFSKTLSMAALRIGYVVAPTWLVSDLEVAVLPYHLDAFKQAATLAALEYVDEMEERVAAIRSERARISAAMSAIGVHVWPSGANFVLFRPVADSLPEAARQVWSAMLDRGVLVRDCSSWDRLSGCLRVTVGTPAENDAFLSALSESVTSLAG